jgi:putative nucleotidyltransferase with HDIG domain
MDRNRAEQAFRDYSEKYDTSDVKITLKIDHTFRVACIADRIAGSLKADRDFAWFLGLLHDIARFEQHTRYGTFKDAKSVDHAEFGADLLFRGDRLIDAFPKYTGIPDWESVAETAIRLHNKLNLPDGLDKTTYLYSTILRDADKIDILRVNCETPRTEIYDLPPEAFTDSQITEAVYEDIMSGRNVDRRNSSTGIDYILGHIGFVYGLVFPESLRMVEEQGYLDELLSFRSRQPETARKMGLIRRKIKEYVQVNL